MTGQTNKLKPCPFCGSTDIDLSNTHTAAFSVECNDCGAEAHGEYFEGPRAAKHIHYSPFPQSDHEGDYHQLPENYRLAADSAVAAWNRRTSAPAGLSTEDLPTAKALRDAIGTVDGKYFGDSALNPKEHDAVDTLMKFAQASLSASAPAAGSVPTDDEIIEVFDATRGTSKMDYLCKVGRALLAQYGGATWLPIESAPKDGRIVILRGPRNSMVAEGYWCEEAKNGEGSWIWPSRNKPVHWMPSPHEPTEGK